MKYLLFSILFASCVQLSFSQEVLKFRCFKSVAYNEEEDPSSMWRDCDMLVTIKKDFGRIKIYSNTPQNFDIIDHLDHLSNSVGTIINFKAVDQDGKELKISFLKIVNPEEATQLILIYPNITFRYELKLED